MGKNRTYTYIHYNSVDVLKKLLERQIYCTFLYEQRLARAHEKLQLSPEELAELQVLKALKKNQYTHWTTKQIMELRSDVHDRAYEYLALGCPELAIWYFGNYNAYQAVGFGERYVDNHEFNGEATGVSRCLREIDDNNQREYDKVLRLGFIAGVIMASLLLGLAHWVRLL